MNILGIKVVMFEGLEGRGDLRRGLAHLTPQAFSPSKCPPSGCQTFPSPIGFGKHNCPLAHLKSYELSEAGIPGSRELLMSLLDAN